MSVGIVRTLEHCSLHYLSRKGKPMAKSVNDSHLLRATDPAPHLTAWLADWPAVRTEIAGLLDTYLRSKPDYDRRRTESVLDALDLALAELAYDAGWLEGKLA